MTEIVAKHKIRNRLIAIVYDALIVFFITFLSALLIQQLLLFSGIVASQQVQISETEIISVIPPNSVANFALKSLWLIIPFLYFGYYWTKRGQTPGMRVWNLKVINTNGSLISWSQAISRYLTALFGFGLIWMAFNKKRQALQDILSKSELIKI